MTNTRVTPLARWYVIVAGVMAGAVYTLSPTTVWFLLLQPPLFAWAGRHLGPRERRWILGLLALAVAVRLIALSGFFLSVDHTKEPYGILIPDEWFIQLRSARMVQVGLGRDLFPDDYSGVFGTYGVSGQQYFLAAWQYWFGAAPYGAHLLNVAMWLVGTVAFHRTARRAFGPLAALPGFVVLLFMPTMFVWSISALKEPAYFFLTAILMAGVMTAWRGPGVAARLKALMLVLGAIMGLASMRTIGLAVTAGGLALAAGGWLLTRRTWLALIVGVLLIVGAVVALRRPAVEARLMAEFRMAAITHLGNVNTPGHGYRLLEPYFYTRDDNGLSYMVPAEAARYAGRAALSFLTVPLPWQAASGSALVMMPEQLAWYVLAALLSIGVVAGWRRDAMFTWLLVGTGLMGAAIVSLYSGNVGTLIRMRDSVVPVIVWLSALGGCVVFDWAAGHVSKRSANGRG